MAKKLLKVNMQQEEPQIDPDESVSTTTTAVTASSLSSLLDTSDAMSSMLHQALGDRDKFYHYLLGDDSDHELHSGRNGIANDHDSDSSSLPDLTGTESTELHSTDHLAVSPKTRKIQNLQEQLQSEQEENAQLHNRLSDATLAQACSDVRAQDLMIELQGLKRSFPNDRQEWTRQRGGNDLETFDYSLNHFLLEEKQRILSPPPSSISSSRARLDNLDQAHWAEKVQMLEKRVRSIQDDSKRIVSELVIELRNKDDERLVACSRLRELEIEMNRLLDSEASLKAQVKAMKKRHAEVEKSLMRELEEAISAHSENQDSTVEKLREECCQLDAAFTQTEKELELKERDLVAEQDENNVLLEQISSLNKQLEASDMKVQQLLATNQDLEMAVVETKSEREEHSQQILLESESPKERLSESQQVEETEVEEADVLDQFSMDIMESLNKFEAKVDAILEPDEEFQEGDEDGTCELDYKLTSSVCPGAADVRFTEKSSPFLKQCQSVVQALTEMVDNTDEEKCVEHDAVVLCKLGSLSNLIEKEESFDECNDTVDSKGAADTGALTFFRESDTGCNGQGEQQLIESEDSVSNRTDMGALAKMPESPIRRLTECPSENGEAVSVESLIHTYGNPHMLNLSTTEEMEVLDSLANPIIKEIFRELHARCELLESERSELISETLDLLESSRQSNAAEIETVIAEIQRKAAHEVWVAEEKAKEHLAELEKLRLAGLD